MAVPVISTRIGGAAEAINDGENGRLVPIGDMPAMTEALGQYLCNPEAARTQGATARETVIERFSRQRMIDRTATLLRHVSEGTIADSPPRAESLEA